jgi:class 3 adenylate cyclase
LLVAESVDLATILLTDLVGSTRLANSVGPVRADELREEHFELLRDAIASSRGKEVKNTGDGLMFAFPSASEAVRCAVAMQQGFERRYRQAEQALHVRIGLSAGESTVKDGDYFGMPSIEAARLCAQAPADGILISAMTKALAGRCDGIDFASAGEFELKGFDEPVEAFSASWAPLEEEAGAPGRWPLPAVLRSVPPVKYVGRLEERAALEEAMKLARSGQRQLVLLSGEPGIGKTRLASYGAHDAHAEGFAVAWGACTEELAVPYEPWIGVCTQLVESAPVELLEQHVERYKGELGRLARNLEGRVSDLAAPQSSDPETERYLLFNAVAGLLGDVAQTVPLCVVLDDLHWTDAQSLALLKHLLRTLEQGSLQLIATFRDSELDKDHPLTGVLADLRRLEGVQRIALHGLGAGDVAEVMASIAGHELAEDGVELAARIAEETDGNPFFVGEILNGLRESGALVFDEQTHVWRIDRSGGLTLPTSVREVIERRVERLGEESLEALRLAAVIGREFDLELLSAIVEMEEARLLDRLEAAVAALVLAESAEHVGRFRFAHALINQTLYDGLGATRRARMHQRVAEALEDLYDADRAEHFGELALHWRLAAVSVDKAKAADYALKAGQQALAKLAPAEALKLFSDAVELIGEADSSERCEALIGLGEAQRLAGAAEYRQTLLDACRIASELQDGERAARAALANNRGWVSVVGQVDQERVAAIERALELDDDLDRRARLLALQADELAYEQDHRHRRALAEQALALANELGNPRTTAHVLNYYFVVYTAPDALERRLEHLDELRASAQVSGDPALEFWAAAGELHTRAQLGELERAENAAERMTAIAERVTQPTLRWYAAIIARAAMAMVRGDLAEVERNTKQGLKIASDAGEPDAFMLYATQMGVVRLVQGRVSDVVALEEFVEANPRIPAWKASLAWTLCWLGRAGEAAATVAEAAADRFEHVLWDENWLIALAMYADAAAQAGVRDAAEILYELIEPWADQIVWSGASSYGHARMYLGLLAGALGWDERADDHFARSCAYEKQRGMLVWAARAHLGWAEALAARSESERAREQAQRALELSREHGYALFEPRAAALVETESAAGA